MVDVVEIRLAWWFRWYVAGVVMFARVTGAEPRMDAIERWLQRAIRMRSASNG